jgi:hypothetical protein
MYSNASFDESTYIKSSHPNSMAKFGGLSKGSCGSTLVLLLVEALDKLTYHLVKLLGLFIERHMPAVFEKLRLSASDVFAYIRAALPRKYL